MRTVEIAGRKLGPGHPCFIIAEAGVNHDGDISLARQLVDVAAQSGADAVKFQTFKASSVIAPRAPKADYQLATTGADESQLEMVKRLELPLEAFRELSDYSRAKKILFLSTPFDEESADFLDELGAVAFKVSSGDLTNTPFLEHLGRKGKPMIVSTGMSYLHEVETAVRSIQQAGNSNIVLLHCTSNYPAQFSDVNLRAMQTMASALETPVGYSDHTLGIEVSLAAVAMGACVIEKHFTLDRKLSGPDHRASLEPQDLVDLVRGVRVIEAAFGDGRKQPAASEANTAAVARRSVVARRDIACGALLSRDDLAVMRPGTGLAPQMLSQLVGRSARVDIPAGTLLALEMLA
jgi:N,N'-diacetyllegionaminate synthase